MSHLITTHQLLRHPLPPSEGAHKEGIVYETQPSGIRCRSEHFCVGTWDRCPQQVGKALAQAILDDMDAADNVQAR